MCKHQVNFDQRTHHLLDRFGCPNRDRFFELRLWGRGPASSCLAAIGSRASKGPELPFRFREVRTESKFFFLFPDCEDDCFPPMWADRATLDPQPPRVGNWLDFLSVPAELLRFGLWSTPFPCKVRTPNCGEGGWDASNGVSSSNGCFLGSMLTSGVHSTTKLSPTGLSPQSQHTSCL